MIRPAQAHEAFLADVRAARSDSENLNVWWLGQSGFLVQWRDKHVLFDPYLSDSLTKKYAGTDKPHIRMTERVVGPECLGFVDVVTSSHNHTDHLDAETLVPILEANPDVELIIPEANREFVVDRLKIASELPVGLDAGKSVSVVGMKFTGVPAAHETIEKDENGRCKFLGYVVEIGPWTIYHSGDTMLYEGMEEWLGRWSFDLAFLPINGRAPERRVAGNMNGREAAQLAKAVRARMVIPCHFEMFAFNTASPDEFVEACRMLHQPHCVLRVGERWTSSVLSTEKRG